MIRLPGHWARHIVVLLVFILLFVMLFPVDRQQYIMQYIEERLPDYSRLTASVYPQQSEPEQLSLYTPPTLAGEKNVTARAYFKSGESKPPQNITVILKDVSYEAKAGDYAVINGLNFVVYTNLSSIKVNVLVYLWDDNDHQSVRGFQRERIPLIAKNYLFANGSDFRTIPVRIPVNDLNLTKTIKLIVADYVPFGAKAYASLYYDFRINSPG